MIIPQVQIQQINEREASTWQVDSVTHTDIGQPMKT